jgi:hypothetical protein
MRFIDFLDRQRVHDRAFGLMEDDSMSTEVDRRLRFIPVVARDRGTVAITRYLALTS